MAQPSSNMVFDHYAAEPEQKQEPPVPTPRWIMRAKPVDLQLDSRDHELEDLLLMPPLE